MALCHSSSLIFCCSWFIYGRITFVLAPNQMSNICRVPASCISLHTYFLLLSSQLALDILASWCSAKNTIISSPALLVFGKEEAEWKMGEILFSSSCSNTNFPIQPLCCISGIYHISVASTCIYVHLVPLHCI